MTEVLDWNNPNYTTTDLWVSVPFGVFEFSGSDSEKDDFDVVSIPENYNVPSRLRYLDLKGKERTEIGFDKDGNFVWGVHNDETGTLFYVTSEFEDGSYWKIENDGETIPSEDGEVVQVSMTIHTLPDSPVMGFVPPTDSLDRFLWESTGFGWESSETIPHTDNPVRFVRFGSRSVLVPSLELMGGTN